LSDNEIDSDSWCALFQGIGFRQSPLTLEGDLDLNGCTSITNLPDNLFVDGDLHLEGCTGITSIPESILNWGLTSDGELHDVFLAGSGLLVGQDAEWLREVNAPNLRFHVTMEENDEEIQQSSFKNLGEACKFWSSAAGVSNQELVLDLPVAYERNVLVFLHRLRGAKEFVIAETQKDFSSRVVELIDLLATCQTGSNDQGLILTRIADSVDACNDKPVWALNQITVLQEVAKARGNRQALRDLGRRVLNLEIVHQHAKSKCDRLQFVDDVCVYLRFEISLRESLDLPVSASSMHFPSYIKVSDDEINAARNEALAITDEPFETWLGAWQEWQRQDRLEKSLTINYDNLREAPMKRASWRKSIRNLVGMKPADTIAFKDKRWSLEEFLRYWVDTGLDLTTNAPLGVDEIDDQLFKI